MARNGSVAAMKELAFPEQIPRAGGPRHEPPRVVVMAASAGGVPALQEVLSGLPEDFPAAVLIVQHRAAAKGSLLEKILQRATPLRVFGMYDGQRIERSCVYVAPPDLHAVLTAGGTLHLHDGRRIRHVRSSANPLFTSTAALYGPDAVAVILTGSGTDAVEGVQAIKAAGGRVIAQDEATSQYFSMPRHAIQTGAVTYVVPMGEISYILAYLVGMSAYPT